MMHCGLHTERIKGSLGGANVCKCGSAQSFVGFIQGDVRRLQQLVNMIPNAAACPGVSTEYNHPLAESCVLCGNLSRDNVSVGSQFSVLISEQWRLIAC